MNFTVFIEWDAKYPNTISSTTSMMVLDVGDKLCWWPSSTSLSPGHFGHTCLLCFYISFGQQLSKKCHQNRISIINTQKMSPTSSYQHRDFTNIIVIRSIYPPKTCLCTLVIGAWFQSSTIFRYNCNNDSHAAFLFVSSV